MAFNQPLWKNVTLKSRFRATARRVGMQQWKSMERYLADYAAFELNFYLIDCYNFIFTGWLRRVSSDIECSAIFTILSWLFLKRQLL